MGRVSALRVWGLGFKVPIGFSGVKARLRLYSFGFKFWGFRLVCRHSAPSGWFGLLFTADCELSGLRFGFGFRALGAGFLELQENASELERL